ncbi:maltodextrin glucosidase [Vibrio ishigakensis]|uniref:Maltodextrin glucosidase n=1 Tax=Vibrio ishigakensis TaxID=1481914 RepID=A0A0B8P522_9VIBR|nr:maltodextrin glucosidase [Vibrio ishigakensis]GAM70558.1 maltodextrin glucosidase [Vibrio sp. JCM 19236]
MLNFDNPEVREYIYDSKDAVIKHWLRPPYNIDGWRFDVIHMLGEGKGAYNNAHYVKAFREATKQENQDAWCSASTSSRQPLGCKVIRKTAP